MPYFYIVATPIGNLEDITMRALRVLREVDVILCEDTRVTGKLLQRYEIEDKTLVSYHAQSGTAKVDKIMQFLDEGKNVALVTDAGTPGISDPGSMLVSFVREREGRARSDPASVTIIPIPGPSALVTALSAVGVPASEFLFLGFLPHKKGRRKMFEEVVQSKRTVVFYESPHRILKTLQSLSEYLGQDRRVCIARELTKIHEQFICDTAEELLRYFSENPDKVRGEFVVIVAKRK